MPEFEFDKGLVLSSKPLGDKKFIVSLFTKEKGRHLGVVKKKMPPLTASFFSGRWQARLSEQMGSFYLEDEKSVHLSFLDDKKRLNVISSMCYLLDHLLPERESYPEFYDLTYHFLTSLEEDDFQKKYIFWEVELLGALGFGLDVVKFFPAENAGGLKMIKAMAAPYTMMKFMPTGGISTSNVREYLMCDKILACGGSWMVKGDLINAGNFAEIEKLTKEAAEIVKEIRN